MREINMIVVHCTATKALPSISVKDIRRWHLERGWSDVGYHYIVRTDGTIEPGRLLESKGAHAAGHNAHSIGVAYVGGLSDAMQPMDTRTDAQKRSLRILIAGLNAHFRTAGENLLVVGHRDLPNVAKSCPCFDVAAEKYV